MVINLELKKDKSTNMTYWELKIKAKLNDGLMNWEVIELEEIINTYLKER